MDNAVFLQADEKHESLVEDKISEKEERRQELEDEFTYDGYQVVRKELFAHLRDPAVTIRYDSITFNTACIDGLEDTVYVNVLINSGNQRLVVKKCNENDVDALRWCVAKPDKRKSRKITSREFSKMLYKEMEWNTRCRYKILGYKIEFEGETLYVFDLKQPEIFVEKPRKKKTVEATEQARRENEAAINADPTIPDDGRVREGKKGFFAEDIRNTFGLPVEEHNKSHEVTEIDGYTSMAILTGNTPKQGV